jgi:hypothetical protein
LLKSKHFGSWGRFTQRFSRRALRGKRRFGEGQVVLDTGGKDPLDRYLLLNFSVAGPEQVQDDQGLGPSIRKLVA